MANDNRATRRAATPEEKKLIRIPIALFDAATSPAKTSDFGPVRELDIGEGDSTFLIGDIWNSSLVVLMMMMSEQAHGLPARVAPGEVSFSQPRLNKALIQLSQLLQSRTGDRQDQEGVGSRACSLARERWPDDSDGRAVSICEDPGAVDALEIWFEVCRCRDPDPQQSIDDHPASRLPDSNA